MTWVLLSLMYTFGGQSSKIVAVLPPPNLQTLSTIARTPTSSEAVPDVPFQLVIDGRNWPWDTLALFVLPGERRNIKISSSDKEGGFDWTASDGAFLGSGARERTYSAPTATGLYRINISRGKHSKRINVFVMIPYRGQTSINGYNIGSYPGRSHFAHLSLPRGFIEVTPATQNAWLSPHFRLKEFVCHQPSNFPKYVALREGIIRKLEYLIGYVQKRGVRCPGLVLISGFRSPSYNSANGNVENSVHTYGGASDVYIDADGDGVMDDLNNDGRHDVRDAIFLYDLCDQMERAYPEFLGGDGYYPGNGLHGAFVHTDVRGERSRWHE